MSQPSDRRLCVYRLGEPGRLTHGCVFHWVKMNSPRLSFAFLCPVPRWCHSLGYNCPIPIFANSFSHSALWHIVKCTISMGLTVDVWNFSCSTVTVPHSSWRAACETSETNRTQPERRLNTTTIRWRYVPCAFAHLPLFWILFHKLHVSDKHAKVIAKMFVDVFVSNFHMFRYPNLSVSMSSYFVLSVCCHFPFCKILSYQRSCCVKNYVITNIWLYCCSRD